MKTQFIVTITQSGNSSATATELARELRDAVRRQFTGESLAATVRHMVEEKPEVATSAAPAEQAAPAFKEKFGGELNVKVDSPVDITRTRRVLFDALVSSHRAGQKTGRLLGPESHSRAVEHATIAMAEIIG